MWELSGNRMSVLPRHAPCIQGRGIHEENPCLPFILKGRPKNCFKRELHTTHLGAVGWESHSTFSLDCPSPPPPLFLDKSRGLHGRGNLIPRFDKFFSKRSPPPLYLKVWIRHCISTHNNFCCALYSHII